MVVRMLLHVSNLADETALLTADRQRQILDRLSKDGQVNPQQDGQNAAFERTLDKEMA